MKIPLNLPRSKEYIEINMKLGQFFTGQTKGILNGYVYHGCGGRKEQRGIKQEENGN